MSWNIIDPGNKRRLSASFTDADLGGAMDPDALFLVVMQPGEARAEATAYEYGVDAEIVKDDVGEYHADIRFPTSGQAFYRWCDDWNVDPDLEQATVSLEQMIEVRRRATAG